MKKSYMLLLLTGIAHHHDGTISSFALVSIASNHSQQFGTQQQHIIIAFSRKFIPAMQELARSC